MVHGASNSLDTRPAQHAQRRRKHKDAMAFQAVPNTAEVDIRGTYFGQQVENTLYFTKDTPFIMADLNDLAALVRSWYFEEVLPMQSSGYTFREVFAKGLDSVDSPSATDIAESGTAGGNSSPGMPGNVSIAISFRTGLAGRSFRGRNYFIGLAEEEVTGNTVSSSQGTALQAAYNALLTVLSDTDFVWAVVSRVTAGAPRATGIATAVVTAVVTDLLIDSQRRRLQGRGN